MKNEKTGYQLLKEEIAAAIQREYAALEELDKKIQSAQNRQKEAKNRMSTALAAGNVEQYKAAGIEAEETRLEVEFYERRKADKQKPAATEAENRKVYDGITSETAHIRTEILNRLETIFLEAVSACKESKKELINMDQILNSWNSTVMKTTGNTTPTATTSLALEQFINMINGQLYRINIMREADKKGI